MSIREYLTFFRVVIEGVDISSWVESLSVTENDNGADYALVSIPDPGMVYAEVFREGAQGFIDMGYTNEHCVMLKGTITKIQVQYPENSKPLVQLKLMDDLIKMVSTKKTVNWNKEEVGSVSEVVRNIAQLHNFSTINISLPNDREINDDYSIQQVGKTDLAFLQDLAREYECCCFIEEGREAEDLPDNLLESISSLAQSAIGSLNLSGEQENLPYSFHFISENTLREREEEIELLYNCSSFQNNPVALLASSNRQGVLLSFYPTVNSFYYSQKNKIISSDPLTGEKIEVGESASIGSFLGEGSGLLDSLGDFASDVVSEGLNAASSLLSSHSNPFLASWLVDHPDDRSRINELSMACEGKWESHRTEFNQVVSLPRYPAEKENFLEQRVPIKALQREGMFAHGVAKGNIWLRAKSPIRVNGLSPRFNDVWYVTSVTHSLDRQGFLSKFKCTR